MTCPGGPAEPVFAYRFTYGQAQRVFNRACEAAELHDVRVHDPAILSPFTRSRLAFPTPPAEAPRARHARDDDAVCPTRTRGVLRRGCGKDRG
jgi:hypothetical protein